MDPKSRRAENKGGFMQFSMSSKRNVIMLGLLLLGFICWLPGSAMAKVAGQCADCHTMHNSQDGADVVGTGPFNALTKGDCVGCHTGTNTEGHNIPYVDDSTGTPNYGASDFGTDGDTLAGGSFYWLRTDLDSYGHNVVGIKATDGDIGQTPPGFDATFSANGQVGSTWASNQLTCAGTYGCHGNHTNADDFADISGAHHADDSTIDGSTVGKSFRFLNGILGLEDPEWEFTPTTALHNQYKGDGRSDDTATDTSTISYLCAECHGIFHSGAGDSGKDGADLGGADFGSPWLRHPTDFDLGDATGAEYADYPGDFGTAQGDYSVVAPVGSADVSAVLSTVTTGSADGTAIVTCISCHRAHGTPYADLLRWDYAANCNVGDTDQDCGCFACHTTKD
jgi:hypothetical protein